MRKIPEKIYLQWFDEDDDYADEVTWCQDQINDSDIVYVLETHLLNEQNKNGDLQRRIERLKSELDALHFGK